MQRIALTRWRDDLLSLEEAILYAVLGKPLILCGHHGDFISGFDRHRSTALVACARVRIPKFFSSNYLTRRTQGTFHVKLLSNHARVRVDRGVERLVAVRLGSELINTSAPRIRPASFLEQDQD